MARFKNGSLISERTIYGDETAAADLILESTTHATKGNIVCNYGAFVPPKIDTAARNAISAYDGMIIFNIDTNYLELYSDGRWNRLMVDTSDSQVAMASEALNAGDMVNIYQLAGTTRARKASATSAQLYCVGYVIENVMAGQNVTVYFEGPVHLTGLAVGERYYLSLTPGQITNVPVTGAGNILQYIGHAVASNKLNFEPDDYIELA